VTEEKPKTPKPKTSRKWRWVLFIIIVILTIFAGAVVYNIEKLPVLNKQLASPGPHSSPNDTTQ
jgi:uncharacterized protein YpmS